MPNRDPIHHHSTTLVEVDPLATVTHVGIQCLSSYKDLVAQASRPTSLVEHSALLNEESKTDGVYTCSASGHVLVDIEKYHDEHQKTEDENHYPVLAHRACNFFSNRNAHVDTEASQDNAQPTTKRALRGTL